MATIDAFYALGSELMLRQGFKLSELIEGLRDITVNASKHLPPVKVLYPASSYHYSEEFQTFLQEKRDSLETICALQSIRNENKEYYQPHIRDAQWIGPFGQHIMEKWPGIAKLVKAYSKNNLKLRMDDIRRIQRDKKALIRNSKTRDKIATETGRTDGKTEFELWRLNKDEDYSVYAPSALGKMLTELHAQRRELTLSVKEKTDALLIHMTKAQYAAMLQSLHTKFAEEEAKAVEEAATPWYERKVERESLSFTEAIIRYGEHHYAVWKNQDSFDEDAMRFLLFYPDHAERLASEGDNVDCTQQLGLWAASNWCRALEIDEVPRLAEWRILESSGREYVELV